jgi:hypothetical protein
MRGPTMAARTKGVFTMRLSKVLLVALAALFGAASVVPTFAKGPSKTGLQHSNKGRALRGLDRANHVAGIHSEAGRTNAAAHHKQ